MTERPNVPVLKTGVGLPTVGSNPTPSAQGRLAEATGPSVPMPRRGPKMAMKELDVER
jgi:hypothetical protein